MKDHLAQQRFSRAGQADRRQNLGPKTELQAAAISRSWIANRNLKSAIDLQRVVTSRALIGFSSKAAMTCAGSMTLRNQSCV
jgi:hypothetical protein